MMKKGGFFLIALISTSIFLLVYTPHYNYPFLRHIDEWHHLTEAIRLQKGEYAGGPGAYRIGFHLLLLPLSKIANLVLTYKFLPAVWAVLSALVLFYVVYRKTGKQFYPALFSMIFFASIKSNVNITGLWFFTPLTFSIPFIYLYVYLLTEGVEKQNKKFILLSIGIIFMLLFVHGISVLFAISFLVIYVLSYLDYVKKEWKFFSVFLLIPLAGILFHKFTMGVAWSALLNDAMRAIQFKRGWGVLELENSFLELYSLMGYILAVTGLIIVFQHKENSKKYLAYELWPIMLLASILIYRKTGISYLSPYQRNLYFFAISLPMLSALGLDYLLKKAREFSGKIFAAVIFSVVIFFSFNTYFDAPKQVDLYEIIDDGEYQALLFLANIPEKAVVMAPPRVSTALYAVSGHTPVGTYFFYGNRKAVEQFFNPKMPYEKRMSILKRFNVKYVLSKAPIDYGWKLIYSDNGNYIYEIEQPTAK